MLRQSFRFLEKYYFFFAAAYFGIRPDCSWSHSAWNESSYSLCCVKQSLDSAGSSPKQKRSPFFYSFSWICPRLAAAKVIIAESSLRELVNSKVNRIR